MGKALSISLCMIVKNEEVCIGTALKSVKSVLGFEDIVVVDTGSVDKTKEIALSYGANIFDFEWIDDFSAAKNFAAENAKNDWILAIDADEEIMEADLLGLEVFTNDEYAVGEITLEELSNQSRTFVTRLYNRRHYKFEGRIHEQIVSSSGIARKAPITAPVTVAHYGYLPEFFESKDKAARNERLLLEELLHVPDDPYVLYQLGKCNYAYDRDLQQACYYFDKALKSFSKDADADLRHGFIYSAVECYGYALVNTGQFEKALELVEKYAHNYQASPAFRFLTAHVLQNNGLFIEAVECYESCIGAKAADNRGITSFLSYYNIGVILECVDMKEDAIKMYKKCKDYEPAKQRLAELGG